MLRAPMILNRRHDGHIVTSHLLVSFADKLHEAFHWPKRLYKMYMYSRLAVFLSIALRTLFTTSL